MNDQRLRVSESPRDLERFPDDDELLGESIFDSLVAGLGRGLPRPACLVVGAKTIHQVDLAGVGGDGPARVMSSLAAVEGAEALVLVGVLPIRVARRQDAVARAAVCFIEWPDNRWWTSWQMLDAKGRLVGTEPIVRCAVEGAPKPGGLGGWFSTARRLRLKCVLRPMPVDAPRVAPPVADDWVH